MSIIAWIVLGLMAGWLAGVLVHGAGCRILGDIVLGILGTLVGIVVIGMLISGRTMTTVGHLLPSASTIRGEQ